MFVSRAIALIKATVSAKVLGVTEMVLNLYFYKSLQPWRCQRRSVSGWTMNSACFQVRTTWPVTPGACDPFWYRQAVSPVAAG
jgi:hypothetical protein